MELLSILIILISFLYSKIQDLLLYIYILTEIYGLNINLDDDNSDLIMIIGDLMDEGISNLFIYL
jgi:hypothetical protein